MRKVTQWKATQPIFNSRVRVSNDSKSATVHSPSNILIMFIYIFLKWQLSHFFSYLISFPSRRCLSCATCLPVLPGPLPWNPSVFLSVWCRWSNMTRAREPIHSHLVICRHFDLPQRSSISIRGWPAGGRRFGGCVCVHVRVCMWMCAHVCVV